MNTEREYTPTQIISLASTWPQTRRVASPIPPTVNTPHLAYITPETKGSSVVYALFPGVRQ